jgi:hypothetical protein
MRNQSTNGFSSEVKSKIDNKKYLISTAKHSSGIWETAIFKVNFLGIANPLNPLRIKRFDTYVDAEKEHSWCEEAVEFLPIYKWDNTADKDIIFTKRDFSSRKDSDGRFIAYDNGTVLDTKTNLMWAANDNGSDIDWDNAKSYCKIYHGGGYTDWRMPTMDELLELYQSDAHIDIIKVNCWVWAFGKSSSDSAILHFYTGDLFWNIQSGGSFGQALPVRSGKEHKSMQKDEEFIASLKFTVEDKRK